MVTNTMTAIATGRTTTGCVITLMIGTPAVTVTTTTPIAIIDGRTKVMKMKALLFASLVTAAAVVALAPEVAQAHSHQVCHWEHHHWHRHRVCHWVR